MDIESPSLRVSGRAVVLMADVASSGHTAAQAARALLCAGAASPGLPVTHPLVAACAAEPLREAGLGQIWGADAVPHATNAVSIEPAVAQVLRPFVGC